MTTYERGQPLICIAGGIRRKVKTLSCHEGETFQAVKVQWCGVEWIVKPEEVRLARWIDTVSKARGEAVREHVRVLRSGSDWRRDNFAIAMNTSELGALTILRTLQGLGFAIFKSGNKPADETYGWPTTCPNCKLPDCLCFKED